MNENYRSVSQTIAALNKQKRIEVIVMKFYIFNVIFFIISIIQLSYCILTGTVQKVEMPTNYIKLVYPFMMIYYSVQLVIEILTIIYFIKMGNSYIDILSEVYVIKTTLFKSSSILLTLWLIFTLVRFDIFVNLI